MRNRSLLPRCVLLIIMSKTVTALAHSETKRDEASEIRALGEDDRKLNEARPCQDNLQLADKDSDGSIDRVEYAAFISAQSCQGISSGFGGLGLTFVSPFYSVACAACHAETGDPRCCYGNNPSIILNDETTSFICDAVSDVIGTCAPSSAPSSIPSSPTTISPTAELAPSSIPSSSTTISPTAEPTLSPSDAPIAGSQQESAAEAGSIQGAGNRGNDAGESKSVGTFPLIIIIIASVCILVMLGVFMKRRADKRASASQSSSFSSFRSKEDGSESSDFDSPSFSPRNEPVEITPEEYAGNGHGFEDGGFPKNTSTDKPLSYGPGIPGGGNESESFATNEMSIHKSNSMTEYFDFFMDCGDNNVEMEYREDD